MVCKRWSEYRQMLVKKNETTNVYYYKKGRDWGEGDCARARGKIWDDVRFAFVICTFVI